MKTAIQILAGCLLLFWFIVAGTAPMMLGAPGASNRLDNLLLIVAVVSYPVGIGALFYLLNWHLWFFSPRGLFFTTLAAPAVALFFLGAPILNLMRGIANEGYTVKPDAVYAGGTRIVGADPKTFVPLGDYYAKDGTRVYRYLGLGEMKVIEGADAASFELTDRSDSADAQQYDAQDKNRRYFAGKPL